MLNSHLYSQSTFSIEQDNYDHYIVSSTSLLILLRSNVFTLLINFTIIKCCLWPLFVRAPRISPILTTMDEIDIILHMCHDETLKKEQDVVCKKFRVAAYACVRGIEVEYTQRHRADS